MINAAPQHAHCRLRIPTAVFVIISYNYFYIIIGCSYFTNLYLKNKLNVLYTHTHMYVRVHVNAGTCIIFH